MRGLRFIVTSVVRRSGEETASGFIRVVDMDSHQILMKSPVPESAYRTFDPNPRGGLRGARGVSIYEDRLVLANNERLLIFDASWQLVQEMTHPLMGGIHDILAEEDGIWITCTSTDLLLKLDWQGNVLSEWEWRLERHLRESLGFQRLPSVDRTLDYCNPESIRNGVRNIIHLNAVNRSPEGLLLSFGRILSPKVYQRKQVQAFLGRIAKSLGLKRRSLSKTSIPSDKLKQSAFAIVRLRPDNRSEVLRYVAGTEVPNHNVVQVDNLLLYNDTNSGELVAIALDKSSSERRIKIPGNPSFIRGLAQIDQDNFLIGSQAPTAVYQVDLKIGSVVSIFLLDGETNESVYSICLLPQDFQDPTKDIFGK